MVLQRLKVEGGLLNPNILNDPRNLICLQSNCVATKRHAGSIHDMLYNALGFGDPYKIRRPKRAKKGVKTSNLAVPIDRPEMGSFLMQKDERNPESKCALSFLFAQYNMGNGHRFYFRDDEYVAACKKNESNPNKARLKAFKQCLKTLSFSSHTLKMFDRILFPNNIGCFNAGGQWPHYLNAISRFSNLVNVEVYIIENKRKE